MTRTLVVCGTDTGIGKTVVAAALAGLIGADYWKPIQTGLDGETDRETVMRLAQIDARRAHGEAYRLKSPASPHRAAELDGIDIDTSRLIPPQTSSPLLIEPVGGLLVPLTRQVLQIDVIARWAKPVVLVASTRLGTINHTLMSVTALRALRLSIAGLVFTGEENNDTQHTIADFTQLPVLGRLPHLNPLDATSLQDAARTCLDIAPVLAAWEHTHDS